MAAAPRSLPGTDTPPRVTGAPASAQPCLVPAATVRFLERRAFSAPRWTSGVCVGRACSILSSGSFPVGVRPQAGGGWAPDAPGKGGAPVRAHTVRVGGSTAPPWPHSDLPRALLPRGQVRGGAGGMQLSSELPGSGAGEGQGAPRHSSITHRGARPPLDPAGLPPAGASGVRAHQVGDRESAPTGSADAARGDLSVATCLCQVGAGRGRNVSCKGLAAARMAGVGAVFPMVFGCHRGGSCRDGFWFR